MVSAVHAWSERLAQNGAQFTGSIIRDLLRLTERPEVISLAGGLPAPECFPAEELTMAAEGILAREPLAALQYGLTEGYRPLRALVIERMKARLAIDVAQEQVLITSGSQQGLDLLGRLFLTSGTLVAVEDPTYLGALQAWHPCAPRYVTVPVDEDGLNVDALERMLADGVRPQFLYIMSCFQNPTGITLSHERRRALVEVVSKYGLPIVEDDAYGELYYGEERPLPVASMDMEMHGELRHVVYLSSFSKVLAPGLRVGWMAAPEELISKLTQVKQGVDLHTNSLSQATVYEACRDGLLDRHVPFIRSFYRTRRDVMLTALEQHMPEDVRWVRPEGGMFVWITLPPHVDSTQLFHTAIKHDVAFVPGATFYANGGGQNTMRLNFSLPTPAQIEEGITRLGQAVRDVI
jgi:2-aminoadipate transaminase